MAQKRDNFKYYTNKTTRAKIDKILKECVSIFANVGTKTPLDVGTVAKAKIKERKLLSQIKDLDMEFYKRVEKQNEA
tara:strand:+ start:956 stop:1186 length:231 start_codon:yes stop_codon:yes gene_type:complete